MRLIKKRSSAIDLTSSTTAPTSSLSTSINVESQNSTRAISVDSDELDLSTIKLPDDFEAKLEQEEEAGANFFTPPPATTLRTQSVGANIFNEIRSEFSLDRFQKFSDAQDWDTDSDLNGEGEGLSEDYVDFLLSYE